jgi:hypothetical protein
MRQKPIFFTKFRYLAPKGWAGDSGSKHAAPRLVNNRNLWYIPFVASVI